MFSSPARIFLAVVILVIFIGAVLNAEVSIWESNNRLAIENSIVRFEYDLSGGRYDAIDKRYNTVCVQDGYFQVDDYPSTASGLVHSWEGKTVSDKLGKGKAITIKSSKPTQPILIFEITLYECKGIIVFGGGIENTTDNPVRVKQIKPLAGGTLFPGFDMTKNFRLMDGNSGGEPLEWGVTRYTAVHKSNYLHSRNNLLMTFGEDETRRSLVMGGLTYHDYEKFATVGQPRKLELSSEVGGKKSLACYLNLPDDKIDSASSGESLCLVKGDGKKVFSSFHSYKAFCGDEITTAAAGEDGVILEASGLDAKTRYYLGFCWWHTDEEDRIQSVTVDSGEDTKKFVLLDKKTVPMWNNKKKIPAEQVELPIPAKAYASGKMRILFESQADTDKPLPVVVSEVWLRKGTVAPLLPSELTPVNETPRPRHKMTGELYAEDPVGKLVDPGVYYLPKDRFYVDFATGNPFDNLEQYGRCIRLAQEIELNMYDFPTVCLWYANHSGYGGGGAKNDTVGAVAEIEAIAKSGFLKYSRAAVRLVPDCYTKNNQQGWWDDEHFQKHGSTNLGDFEGGTYKAPYETSEKWGKAITERGGIPLTYCQTGFRSEDYAHAFPEHMLFNKSVAWRNESDNRPLDDDEFWGNAWRKNFQVWGYDYTDPEFIKHVREVYKSFRVGGIKGLMFDYPSTGWASSGGMEDKYATTAQAYRNIYKLAYEGLGPESYLDERNMERGSDITLGLVASQRTENDTDLISPGVVTRCGLRWYKNRVVVNYDTDSKNIARLQEDRDVVRSLLTMSYVTTGRLLLANSFTQLKPEIIHDLTRIYPFHVTAKTARPVDAFTQKYPRIYDFEVSPAWHQLTLYNTEYENKMDIDITLSGNTAEGGLGLNPNKGYYAYDFWNDAFVGKISGNNKLSQQLRPGEARMISIHEAREHPQFISTNRHIMQGYIDLVQIEWLPGRNILRGISKITGDDPYVITAAANGYVAKTAEVNDPDTKAVLENTDSGLVKLTLTRSKNAIVEWTVKF